MYLLVFLVTGDFFLIYRFISFIFRKFIWFYFGKFCFILEVLLFSFVVSNSFSFGTLILQNGIPFACLSYHSLFSIFKNTLSSFYHTSTFFSQFYPPCQWLFSTGSNSLIAKCNKASFFWWFWICMDPCFCFSRLSSCALPVHISFPSEFSP